MIVTQDFSVYINKQPILKNINLEFGPGVHIIMGRNGVGKSTFGHALMGNPNYKTDGAAQLNGKDLLAMETFERAQAGLFLSFQNPTPIEGLSNFQFVKQFLPYVENMDSITETLQNFKTLSAKFRLPEGFHSKQLNVEASGGEKKKSEIIQMMLADPMVAILDEPDSGLDIDAINELVVQLNEFMQRDPEKVLIVVTHYDKLIEKLNPDTVTIFGKQHATTYDDISVAYEILEHGFSAYG